MSKPKIYKKQTESLTHITLKNIWESQLIAKGFIVEFEKRIERTPTDYMIVDVYAESTNQILIVEAVHTGWSGKHPKQYIQTEKELLFIVAHSWSKQSITAICGQIMPEDIYAKLKHQITAYKADIRQLNKDIEKCFQEIQSRNLTIQKQTDRITKLKNDLVTALSPSLSEATLLSLEKDLFSNLWSLMIRNQLEYKLDELRLDSRILKKLVPILSQYGECAYLQPDETIRVTAIYTEHCNQEGDFLNFAYLDDDIEDEEELE